MDTLSHALWGYGLFGYKRYPWAAIFFGAMPDLISFGIFLLINITTGNWYFGKPALESIPDWLFLSYSVGHSFIICLPIIYCVYRLIEHWLWPCWLGHFILFSIFHFIQKLFLLRQFFGQYQILR